MAFPEHLYETSFQKVWVGSILGHLAFWRLGWAYSRLCWVSLNSTQPTFCRCYCEMRNPTTVDFGTEPQKFLFRLNWPFFFGRRLGWTLTLDTWISVSKESNEISILSVLRASAVHDYDFTSPWMKAGGNAPSSGAYSPKNSEPERPILRIIRGSGFCLHSGCDGANRDYRFKKGSSKILVWSRRGLLRGVGGH